jgi:hypothetical protein
MTPICIAGMHQSGIAATAQLLHRCGVRLGDESVRAAADDNADSRWEDARFVAINDAILGAFGGAWDDPPAMDRGWLEDERLASVRKDAEALRADCAEQPTPWGWADPRNSLTFPFWQWYFPEMKVVFCLRDPLAVAHALFARAHHSYIFGLNMWHCYNAAFVDAVPPDQRIVTAYDASADDARAELARVLAFLGIATPIAVQDQAFSAVFSGLRHQNHAEHDLHDAGVGAAIIDLYARLREEAGRGSARTAGQRPATDGALPAPHPRRNLRGERAVDAASTPLPPAGVGRIEYSSIEITRLRREIADVRLRFASLEAAYRALEHHHHDLEHQLRGIRAEYSQLAAYCGNLDREIADRDGARQEVDSYLRALERQLAASDDEREETARYVRVLTRQIDEVQGEHERATHYVRTLEGEIAAREEEQARISGYVQLLAEQLTIVEGERGRAEKYVQALEGQIAALKEEQAQIGGYVQLLEREQVHDVAEEQARASGYARTLEKELAAAKAEQAQASGYLRTLERQLFAADRARQEAEIRLVSLERHIAQQRGNSRPERRP